MRALTAARVTRALVEAAAAAGAWQLVPRAVARAAGAEPVRIGFDDTLTGTYAALGKNTPIGCELAVEQIDAKGGIMADVFRVVSSMRGEGMAVLLVEEDVRAAVEIADRVYVLDDGRVAYEGRAAELSGDEERVRSLAGASAGTWEGEG